jgi:type IX secretion system PorP/SprF family membrane protein
MSKLYPTRSSSIIKSGILSVFLYTSSVLAQDIHFSQYLHTPTLVNPALTGATHTLRAAVIYKDQWRGVTVPYKTYGASFEMKLKASNWDKADDNKTKSYKKSVSRLAAGLSFFSDKAGDGNMGTSQVIGSLASFVPVNDKNSLSIGLQTSMIQRSIDFSKLVFPDQYNGSVYDPNISNGENQGTQNYIYADVGAGVNWSYGYGSKAVASNDGVKIQSGIALFHINKPRPKFITDSKEEVFMKVVLHGDAALGVKNTNMVFVPSYLLQFQGPSKEIMVGLMTKYYFKEDSKYTGFIKQSAFGIGAAYRNLDALILSAQIEVGQYAVGFSYDFNTSKLSKASAGRGGAEIFLRFVTPNPFLYQMSTKKRYNLN